MLYALGNEEESHPLSLHDAKKKNKHLLHMVMASPCGSRKVVPLTSHYMAVHASVPIWISPTDQLRLNRQQELATAPLCEGAACSFQPTSSWQEPKGTTSLATMLQSAFHATEAVGAAAPGSSWGSPGPLPATVHQVCRHYGQWTPVLSMWLPASWHCCRFVCCLTVSAL